MNSRVLLPLIEREQPLRKYFLSDESYQYHTSCRIEIPLHRRAQLLLEAHQQELVIFSDDSDACDYLEKQHETLELESYCSIVDAEENVWVELTAKGGSFWEAAANPNWENFFRRISLGGEDPFETWKYTCCDEKLIKKICDLIPLWMHERVVSCTGPERISPWEGLYWRSFTVGFEFTLETACDSKIELHEEDYSWPSWQGNIT